MDAPDFSTMTTDQLIAHAEENTNLHQWDRRSLYNHAMKKFEADGNDERALDMRRDMLMYEIAANNKNGQRFHPQMSGTRDDGTTVTYPDWDIDFDADTLDYLKRRAEETTNPAIKSRYADLLWERGAGFTYGRMAAKAYLDAAPHYYAADMILEFGDALERALVLAAKFRDKELVKEAIDAHHRFIQRIIADKRFRPMLEVADSLLAQAPKNKEIDLTLLADALEATIADYAQNDPGNYLIRQSFLDRLARVRAQQKDAAFGVAAKVRQAETFVEEAEEKGGVAGGLLAAHWYEEALKVYLALGGHDERVAELKVLVSQANEVGRAEYKTITTPIEIPLAPIAERLDRIYRGRPTAEIFQVMTLDPQFVTSWEDALIFARQLKVQFPLQFLMSTQVMREGNIAVKTLTTDEEKIEYKAIEHFQQHYHLMAGAYLRQIFDLLRADHPDYLDELARFFATSEIITAERVEMLRHTLRLYGMDEWVGAIHILAFQIEGILRDMIGKAGRPTWGYARGTDEMRARMLSDIIEELELSSGFDKDFLKLINLVLNHLLGDNIRNAIGHALMPAKAFGRHYAELLLLIIIKLVPYGIATPAAATPSIPEAAE